MEDPRLEKLEKAGLMFKSRTRARLALLLYESPRRSSELESLEGTSPSSVHRILEDWEKEGLVSREKVGEAVYWRLTDSARSIMDGLLGVAPKRRIPAARLAEALAGLGVLLLGVGRGLLAGRADWIAGGALLGALLVAHALYSIYGSRYYRRQ